MQSQRQAVYVAIMNVLADANVSFDDGQTPTAAEVLTKDQRKAVQEIVTMGLINGEVEFSSEARAKYDTVEKTRNYTSGLVNNWLRKDKRLNGNVKYEAKNPGSRAGAGDEQIKALKLVRAAKADDADAVKAIDEAIAQRQAEIKSAKPAVTLTAEQIAALPEELREKLGL